ncbi:hypothetical protein FN846DRAFT_991800, partial [Sphaerosporella brunnea]
MGDLAGSWLLSSSTSAFLSNLHDLETEDFGWFNGVQRPKCQPLRNKAEHAIVRRYIPEGELVLEYPSAHLRLVLSPRARTGSRRYRATSFIDPFARYPTSPSVRTYSDPPGFDHPQFPPVCRDTPTRPHQPPGGVAAARTTSGRLNGVLPDPTSWFVDPDSCRWLLPAWRFTRPLPPPPPAFRDHRRRLSRHASPVAIHAPSREASVKSEVAAIVKEELDEQKEPETSPVQLQTLFHDVDVKTMERGVDRGLELLYKLDRALEGAQTEEGKAWLAQIAKIRKQAEFQRCVIGVVGNTGAGKQRDQRLARGGAPRSDFLHACLHRRRHEISYNTETDHPYRAKIEFISEADWLKELKPSGKTSRRVRRMRNVSRDADAQVAWEKIKAVYPGKTKETLTKLLPTVWSANPRSRWCWEKPGSREHRLVQVFYKDLQRYV